LSGRPGRGGTPGGGRKALQLAAQIGRSIESTLVGECRDQVLQNTSVEKVEPASGNRLLVTLRVHPPGSALDKVEVLARLEAQRGLILDRLFRDVNRRSLPELSFWLIRDPETAAGPAAADPALGDDPDPAAEDEDWDPPSILDEVD
jgi:ribosome-binding factor A